MFDKFSDTPDDEPLPVDIQDGPAESEVDSQVVVDMIKEIKHDAGLDLETIEPHFLKGPPPINDSGVDLTMLSEGFVRAKSEQAQLN